MAEQRLLVIDNFYDNPDEIRALALGLAYKAKPGATYPGREAIAARDWSAERTRLRRFIEDAVDAPCPKSVPFPQGKFRLALADDEAARIDRVHTDIQKWSGIVYLTLDEHCHEGLSLYRHRQTRNIFFSDAWLQQRYPEWWSLPLGDFRLRVLDYFRDERNFERIGVVPMAYNRAVLLMAHILHGTGVAFGDRPDNARLTQHFEFYAE
jgi:hypothetical protein